jgi:hypothetical protein
VSYGDAWWAAFPSEAVWAAAAGAGAGAAATAASI